MSKEKCIKHAIEVLQEPCGACKDCDEMCMRNIIPRILRGLPSTHCPICDEWWNGPVEYLDGDTLGMKEIKCPSCREPKT